ncbi:MAG TPA: hypothetical protein VGZ26_03455 [Pirellulales bacterium]|jgi:hypothetical protein|nr:hypothetical protein [Pirellulales bacterium]
MTKNYSSAGHQPAFAARRPLILAALLAGFFAPDLQRQSIAAEADQHHSTWERERESAATELQLAHGAAEKARSAATSEKAQLDDFVRRHFDDHQQRGAAPLPKLREPKQQQRLPDNPSSQQLKAQFAELKARREEMLTRLMPAHPDVVELDDRIAALFRRLALEPVPADGPAPRSADDRVDAADGSLAEFLASERERHKHSSAVYEELLARWQSADRDLQAAVESERQAAERLADIKPPVSPAAAVASVTPPPFTQPLPLPKHSESRPTAKSRPQGSQPLALAVLLIALVVVALAAVKLARSSADVVFTSAAEVSAALALPVVGIIPAVEMANDELPATRRVARGTRLLAEVLLAVAVFVAVAYLVQDPSIIWQICIDPADGLSRLMRLFRLN